VGIMVMAHPSMWRVHKSSWARPSGVGGMCTAGSRPCHISLRHSSRTCDEVGHLVVSAAAPVTGLFAESGGVAAVNASTLCVVRRHRRWRGCKRGGLCIRNGLHAAPFRGRPRLGSRWPGTRPPWAEASPATMAHKPALARGSAASRPRASRLLGQGLHVVGA